MLSMMMIFSEVLHMKMNKFDVFNSAKIIFEDDEWKIAL
jgi:hypothetical protein